MMKLNSGMITLKMVQFDRIYYYCRERDIVQLGKITDGVNESAVNRKLSLLFRLHHQ